LYIYWLEMLPSSYPEAMLRGGRGERGHRTGWLVFFVTGGWVHPMSVGPPFTSKKLSGEES
jgi:hypothetical protein